MQTAYTVLILLMLVGISRLLGRVIPLPLPLVQIAAGAVLAWPTLGLHVALEPELFLFLFLPIFLGLYYLSGQRYRNLLLLVASYIFYAWWRVDFLALFAGVTLWNYWIGLKVGAAGVRTKPAQRWLLLGVGVDLCILGYFKYANFGVEVIAADLEAGKTVLVTAHGNSLRALYKYLNNVSREEILELNIPTGIPLLFELNDDLSVQSFRYLGDPEAAKKAAENLKEKILFHGAAMLGEPVADVELAFPGVVRGKLGEVSLAKLAHKAETPAATEMTTKKPFQCQISITLASGYPDSAAPM